MSIPFMGSAEIVVREVRDVDIHGSRYLDVVFEMAGQPGGTPEVARIGLEAVAARPEAGQVLTATFAMRQIIELRAAQ